MSQRSVEALFETMQQSAARILQKASTGLRYNESSRQIQILNVPQEFIQAFSAALMVMEGSASGSLVGWRPLTVTERDSEGIIEQESGYAVCLPVEPHALSPEQMDVILKRMCSFGLLPNLQGRFEYGTGKSLS